MVDISPNTILALSTYHYDGLLSYAGTLSKLKDDGAAIYMVIVAMENPYTSKEFTRQMFEKELNDALGSLGVPNQNLLVFPFSAHDLDQTNLLSKLQTLESKIHPKLVFTPVPDSYNPDDYMLSRLTMNAFLRSSILGYQNPWNKQAVRKQCYVELDETNLQKKIEVTGSFASIRTSFSLNSGFIKSQAVVAGTENQMIYSENFEVLQWII